MRAARLFSFTPIFAENKQDARFSVDSIQSSVGRKKREDKKMILQTFYCAGQVKNCTDLKQPVGNPCLKCTGQSQTRSSGSSCFEYGMLHANMAKDDLMQTKTFHKNLLQ